jgi:hypothetical protein
MIENFKARLGAKKYNLYTEEIDPKSKINGFISGYYIYKDKIYFGHPFLLIFFKTSVKRFKPIIWKNHTKK